MSMVSAMISKQCTRYAQGGNPHGAKFLPNNYFCCIIFAIFTNSLWSAERKNTQIFITIVPEMLRSTNYDVDVASSLRTQAGQSLHIISNILNEKA